MSITEFKIAPLNQTIEDNIASLSAEAKLVCF